MVPEHIIKYVVANLDKIGWIIGGAIITGSLGKAYGVSGQRIKRWWKRRKHEKEMEDYVEDLEEIEGENGFL